MRHVAVPLAGLAFAVLDTSSSALAAQDPVTAPAGCYDIAVGDWYVADSVPNKSLSPLPDEGGDSVFYEIPPRIEFVDPLRRASQEQDPDSEMRIVVPEGALPSVHGYMAGRIVGDSLGLSFSTGHSGVTAVLGRSGDGWTGIASTFVDVYPRQVNARSIELVAASCDSPPPVSIDAMRPVARSVELEGGVVIALGRPLPESVRTAPTRYLDSTLVVGRTTGAFATTDSIEIEAVAYPWWKPDVEVVTGVYLRYPREDYQRLSARFREMFGSPDRYVPDESEPTLRWENRITELWLWVTGRRDDDFRTLVFLRARNF